jgi:hypothetical protein
MTKAAKRLFICLDNAGYEVSLERLKIYVALADAKAERTQGGQYGCYPLSYDDGVANGACQ